ncbi:oligosaccharide flippase family protein [Morganella morganii]|uniref:oligosaccharide flippase family protein n=1 Tax=Morganella morganii TaxID=582 RepID=UPI0034D55348
MKFNRNIYLFYLLTILNGIVPFLVISFISRIFSTEDFGVYLLSFTIMNVWGMIVDFGFSISGVRALKNQRWPSDTYITATFIIKTVIFAITLIIYLIIISIYNQNNITIMLLISLGVYFTGIDCLWILQSYDKLYKIIKKNIAINIVYIIVIISSTYYIRDVTISILVFILYRISIFLLSYLEVRKLFDTKIKLVTLEDSIAILKNTVGIAIFRIFAFSYTSSNGILLNVLTNKSQVALYLALEKINKMMLFIATPLSHALLPYFSERKNNKGLVYYIITLVILSIVAVTISNILSPTIIFLFIGEKYTSNTELFFYMTISVPFILTSNAIGMLYIIPRKLDNILNIIIIFVAISNFSLSLLFVSSSTAGAIEMARIVALSEFMVMIFTIITALIHSRLKNNRLEKQDRIKG